MINNPDYLKSKHFITLITHCMEHGRREFHVGFSRFYAQFLLQAYKKQGSYKKAFELQAQYNLI